MTATSRPLPLGITGLAGIALAGNALAGSIDKVLADKSEVVVSVTPTELADLKAGSDITVTLPGGEADAQVKEISGAKAKLKIYFGIEKFKEGESLSFGRAATVPAAAAAPVSPTIAPPAAAQISGAEAVPNPSGTSGEARGMHTFGIEGYYGAQLFMGGVSAVSGASLVWLPSPSYQVRATYYAGADGDRSSVIETVYGAKNGAMDAAGHWTMLELAAFPNPGPMFLIFGLGQGQVHTRYQMSSIDRIGTGISADITTNSYTADFGCGGLWSWPVGFSIGLETRLLYSFDGSDNGQIKYLGAASSDQNLMSAGDRMESLRKQDNALGMFIGLNLGFAI